jgi:mRNA-degrading endonuclease RelE of RelBE toxin-antitoxin system
VSEFIWTERAKGQLWQIDRDQALQSLHALSDYASNGKGEIKKLRGSGDLRLRVGDYRVRFEVVERDKFRILCVDHGKRTGVRRQRRTRPAHAVYSNQGAGPAAESS